MPTVKLRRQPHFVRAFAIPALLCAACASQGPKDDFTEVGRLIAHAEYEEAVRVAAQRHEEKPDDAEREREWRVASAALLLERGRRASFEDRDMEALDFFRQAHALAPDVPQTQRWVDSTLDKLAAHWMELGIEWHAQDNLESAIESYEKALSFRPEDPVARESLARALLQQNYRSGMSQNYYEDGIKALDAYWIEEAAHDFSASLKYREEHERATRRRSQTEQLRADDRAALALALEGAGQWAASRNEYRIALLIDKDHAEALAGRDRMQREERVAHLLREARRQMLRKDLERAQQALSETAGLTERQEDDVEAAYQELAHAQLQRKYDTARSLENDFRYEDAISAYNVLLAETPSFEDAIARKDTLEDFVSKAQRHYAEAAAATEPAAELAALRQVMIVYPEFKDVRDRVEALEAQLRAKPPAEQP